MEDSKPVHRRPVVSGRPATPAESATILKGVSPMNNNDPLSIIESFTAPQSLRYFLDELEKLRKIPYDVLVAGAFSYFEQLERKHDRAYDGLATKFNHKVETRFIVKQYAYAGAIELNDPCGNTSVEDVIVHFINAYNALKKRRNEAKKEIDSFPMEYETLMFFVSRPAMFIDPTADLELSETVKEILNSLPAIEQDMVKALANNPDGLSHKAIANRLGMDPAMFSRRLKRIRKKFVILL